MMTKNALLLFMLFANLFAGCVAKQTVPYFYNPPAYDHQKIKGSVEALVKDERPYILDGDKDPSYIGHFRAGLGNTWDVKTKGNIALAEQFQQDLQNELKMLSAGSNDPALNRTLRVSILDYNFDAYINVRFWYKFKVAVYDAADLLLAQETVEDEQVIKGSFWWGPAGATKREMPIMHEQIMRTLVRDNEEILRALSS